MIDLDDMGERALQWAVDNVQQRDAWLTWSYPDYCAQEHDAGRPYLGGDGWGEYIRVVSRALFREREQRQARALDDHRAHIVRNQQRRWRHSQPRRILA